MENLFKFNRENLTPNLRKAKLQNIHTSLSNSVKILSFFPLCFVAYMFLTQIQELIFLAFFVIFFIVFKTHFISSSPTIYLVDYSCLKPPNYWTSPFPFFLEQSRMAGSLDQEGVDFISRVLKATGQGERAYLPPALHYSPPSCANEGAIKEAKMVLFPVFEDLLSKTKLSPLDIDIVIVNCGGFCPSPSLSSIIVNAYSMREDVKSFNISGMGCSASALAVDMAQNLLKVHKNSNAVILSTEILSTGWYAGKERSMLVLNCLFRSGSAAILITNKPSAKKISKYKLLYSIRRQCAFDDVAYNSAIREEDSQGITGVTLRKNVPNVSGEFLRTNFHVLGSSLLPLQEKIRYGFSIIKKKFLKKSTPLYVPKFRKVIQHYCLTTFGKSVIFEIRKNLKLRDEEIEPALMTLHRFGNQSSSSWWYELAYIEGKEKVKKGERVLLYAVGTGLKSCGLVWESNRNIVDEAHKGPWADSIHSYPVYSVKNDKSMI